MKIVAENEQSFFGLVYYLQNALLKSLQICYVPSVTMCGSHR